MSGKYGFSGAINLPTEGEPTHRAPVDRTVLREAIRAGNELGFVDRDPSARRKPGPKRTELQGKVRSLGRSVLSTDIGISVLSGMSPFGGVLNFFLANGKPKEARKPSITAPAVPPSQLPCPQLFRWRRLFVPAPSVSAAGERHTSRIHRSGLTLLWVRPA